MRLPPLGSLVLLGSLLPAAGRAEGLSLRRAMELGVARSAEVAAAKAAERQAALEEPLLLSNTDPVFQTGFTRLDDRAPRALPAFEGSRARIDRWNAGFAANTLLGTEARLRFDNERIRNPTPFRVFDPSVTSRLSLEVRQPLLRYFWGRPDKARRSRARAGVQAAEQRVREASQRAAAGAARTFIELRFAEGRQVIVSSGVADARRLLEKYEEKKRYGLAEESDVLQARASLELQETELLQAEAQARRARYAFAAALYSDAESPAPGPLEGLPEEPAADEAAALARRPDVTAAKAEVAAREWSERTSFLDTLPDLALTASWGAAGLDTGYGRAWSDLAGFDHPVAAAGIAFSIPLGQRKERLTRAGAKLALEAAKAEAARLEAESLRQVRDARELLTLARRRTQAGRRLLELERRKFGAEEANFKRGRSSTDLLVRFQQDIRRAETELLRAEADEASALVELARASGALLEGRP